ncbi:MAG: hypothetical protein WC637_09940 [Victivallales bacterium]
MSLEFKFPRNEEWRSKASSIPEQDMVSIGCRLFEASPDEDPAKFVVPFFHDSNRHLDRNLKGSMIFQKLLVDGKEMPVDSDLDSTNMFLIGSPKVTLTYAICNLFVANEPKVIIKKDTIEFNFPPNPPLLKISSDENGISLSWDDCMRRFDPKNFLTLPKIAIYRGNNLIKKCELSETSFVDNDKNLVYGNEYEYHLAFTNCIMKTQGYIEGVKNKDFYIDIVNINHILTNNGTRGNKVFCRANKGIASPVAISSRAYQKSNRIPMEGPLTVGLIKGEMCFEGTGVLENIFFTKVVEALLKEKDIEVMDRVNSDNLLKTMIDKLPQDKRKRFGLKSPDFVVRLRDYSDETGNGVELWLIRLTDGYSSPADVHTWRIGRIGLKDNADGKYDQLAVSLVSKMREVAASTFNIITPAKEMDLIPKNIIFTSLLPADQPDSILQYKAISESIILGASENLGGLNILSPRDWSIRTRERIFLEGSGVELPPDSFADLLISGRMWKVKDVNSYLFIATDLMTSRVVGTLCLSGKIDNVASAMGKWCSSLKICRPDKDLPLSESQINLDFAGKLRLYSGKFEVNEVKSPEDAFISTSPISPLASELAKAGDFMSKINILEEAWNRKHDTKVGEQLAGFYNSAGMYALEAALWEELSKRGVNVNAEKLNRAKSLASSSSALVASDSFSKKKRTEAGVGITPTTSPTVKISDNTTKFTTRDYKAEEWFAPDDSMFTTKFTRNSTCATINQNNFLSVMQGIKKYPNARIPFWDSDNEMPWEGTAIDFLGILLNRNYMICVRDNGNLQLNQLFVADAVAKKDVTIGKKVVHEAKSQDVDKIASALDRTKERKGLYNSVDLVVYRAYAGDEKALAYLSDQKWIRKVFWDNYDYYGGIKDISLYLMAEAGREDALATLLAVDRKVRRFPLRNINGEFMKKFIVRHPSLFEPNELARLFEGYRLEDQAMGLITVPNRGTIPADQLKGILLLQGRPLKEIIADMETKYYAEKK